MPDTFAVTIFFIVIVTVIAAFVKGRSRDKCINDFTQDLVTLEKTSGKEIWGKLRVENTGLELVYPNKHKDQDGHIETSYILYKKEYPNIQAIIRYYDELDDNSKKKREAELIRTNRPSVLKKLKRKTRNFFNTVRDSFMEVVNLLIGRAKQTATGGAILASQDKHISKLKHDLAGSVETAYEPLLERHIGKIVVFEMTRGKELFEYSGVLKDYTANFIEIMDVNYRVKEDKQFRKADMVVPRVHCLVRHLGE